jgi:Na+-exporting ATPase
LTGDHLATATAISKEVGILPSDSDLKEMTRDVVEAMVCSAQEFDALSDDQIDQLPCLPRVIARCAPSTKVRMIEAMHRRGRFVVMVCASHLSS